MASITAVLAQPAVWLALILAAVGLAFLAWRLRLAWRPAWLLRFLMVGLSLLALFATQWSPLQPQPLPTRQVMVVDQSDSLDEDARQQALKAALQWQAGALQQDNFGQPGRMVVVFGSEARPLLPERAPEEPTQDTRPAVREVDGRASSLPDALHLAGDLLGRDPGQIWLASDGLAEQPSEVIAQVAGMTRQGHTFQIIPLTTRSTEMDLALGSLVAPRNVWAGTPVDLLVPVIRNGGGAPAVPQLDLKINGQAASISAQPVEGSAAAGGKGAELYRYQISTLPEGIVTLEVTAKPAGPEWVDPFPGNNSSYAVLQVFPPPRGLLVTAGAETDQVTRFSQALEQQQIQLDVIQPEELSTNLDALQQYQVIFIDNLLSNQLRLEQMTALRVFVSDLAGGLVFSGGRNSYTLGGYEGTPVEAMLPVKLEPPPRNQHPPLVFQLVLDRSSSMLFGNAGKSYMPIDLAREAAIRAIETLQPGDTLGVLTFNHEFGWDIPLMPLLGIEGLKQAAEAVSQVEASGGTKMYQAMQETLSKMAALPADAPPDRHILVLSDGESADGSSDEFDSLAEAAHAQGITVSTIALGSGADEKVMQRIAEAGKGRYYSVTDAIHLPRILIAESKAARSENIQAGETSLKSTEDGHPVLSGISADQLPTLRGYNALQSKAGEGAEDILVSANFGDPVLSAWQYGLGRVAAWTGDLGGEWTSGWQVESQGVFWARVIRYMLVDPAQSPAQASVLVEPTRLVVDAAVYAPDGSPINLSEVTFSFANADNQVTSYRLMQNSTGIYRAELPRPPDGAYRAVLTYTGPDGKRIEVPAPFAANPPPEWLPQAASTGANNLAAWAIASGGSLASLQDLQNVQQRSAGQTAGDLDDALGSTLGGTLERLLLALVLLWPIEIAIRRRWLPWRDGIHRSRRTKKRRIP